MADSFRKQFNAAMRRARPSLQKKIDETLDNEVAAVVKKEEHDQVYETVYSRPVKDYDRRMDAGGLSDIRNMKHTVADGVLIVRNNTPPNPYLNGVNTGYVINDGDSYHERGLSSTIWFNKSIAELVEYGIAAPFGYGYDYSEPDAAPFTKKTIEALLQNGDHTKAMRIGLSSRGLKIE